MKKKHKTCINHRRRHEALQDALKMRRVHDDAEGASSGLGESLVDKHLDSEGDDAAANAMGDETLNGLVDVARVAGGHGGEEEEDLARAVGRHVPANANVQSSN